MMIGSGRPGSLALFVLLWLSLSTIPATTDAASGPYPQAVQADRPSLYLTFDDPLPPDTRVDLAPDEQGVTHVPGATPALGHGVRAKEGAGVIGWQVRSLEQPLIGKHGVTLEWWQYTRQVDTQDKPVILIGRQLTAEKSSPVLGVFQVYEESQKDKKDPRGKWALWVKQNNGEIAKHTAPTWIQPDRWYHVVLTFDTRSGEARFYVNGQAAGDVIQVKPISLSNKQALLRMALGQDLPGESGFAGALDEVAVYPDVLTADRVMAHYRAALNTEKGQTMPAIVAHRGNHRYAPENTAVSYQQAIEAGAPIVELDLNMTSDGEVILLHDSTLDRTTTGSGKVAEHTLDQVRALDAGSWKDAKYAGEPVPTFEQIATLCKDKTVMMLDLKTEVTGDRIISVLEKTGFDPTKVIVAPWKVERARGIAPYLPDSPMILLHSDLPAGHERGDVFFDELKEMGFSGFSLSWKNLTLAFVQAAQRNGMKVYTWTINSPEHLSGATLMGVDGIITDIPKEAAEVVNTLGDTATD